MRKIFIVLVVSLLFIFIGCKKKSENSESVVLTVACTPVPHGEMLNLIKEDLSEKGIKLIINEYTEYNVENEAVESGEADANFFQHYPYLNQYIADGYHLVSVGEIHVEPFAVYSKKYSNLNSIPSGATIAIPNDPTNEGRALLLLESAGLIKLDDSSNLAATPVNIVSNPKKLKFHEVEAATTPRILQDVDAAIINGNYALDAGLTASKDGLFVEGADSPYVNVIVVKQGRENDEAIKALVEALKSEKIKDWVLKKYPNGDVVTVF